MPGYHYYYLIPCTIILTGLGLPLPEEIPVVTAGVMLAHPNEDLRWYIMLPACILAVIIGDGCLYAMGRFGGPKLLEIGWVKKHVLPPERRARIEQNFHDYGVAILLFARFMPTIRTPIFVSAGIMRVPFAKFVLADGLYAVPGVSLLMFLGWMFTDQFLSWIENIEQYRYLVVIVLLLLFSAYLVYHFMRHPVATGDPRAEVPIVGDRIADKMSSISIPAPDEKPAPQDTKPTT